jgi:hypothetical protein
MDVALGIAINNLDRTRHAVRLKRVRWKAGDREGLEGRYAAQD